MEIPSEKDASSSSSAGEGEDVNENVGIQYPYELKFRGDRKGYRKYMMRWGIWEQEHEKWIDENWTDDVNLDNVNEEINEIAEPSSDLLVPLLRYQKEWLAWALKQEESPNKGGILADEMGMGKTVQAIALVLAKRELHRSIGRGLNSPSTSACPSTGLPEVRATLVVCPVAALSHWVGEIFRFTAAGSTRVLVYHGANRSSSLEQFEEYDFVLTTYSLLEADYRKYLKPPRTKCPDCGDLLYRENLLKHYACRPNAVKTAKQSKKQKEKSLDQRKQKPAPATDMFTHFIAEQLNRGKSPLHSVRWNRIILDEAHLVKNRRSNTAKAVFALDSLCKWGLSGTILPNDVDDLYSVIRFLQIVPYSYFFSMHCDCRSLDYCATGLCGCQFSNARNICWWERVVGKPIRGSANKRKRAMILLKHEILKSLLMRRTKKGRAADLALPPRMVRERRNTLDTEEEEFYVTLKNESRSQFDKYVQSGTVMNNYMNIFHLLRRLRQAVDHRYLVVYPEAAVNKSKNAVAAENGEQVCAICHDPLEDPVVTSCMHSFCKACLIDFSASAGKLSCPQCSEPITVDLSTRADVEDQPKKTNIKGFKASSILNRISLKEFQTCTKIEALREEIWNMIQRDGSAKGIVFSQFTPFLDLINFSLQQSGVGCVQLVGDMSSSARDACIKTFTEDPDCRIFLMSLKAGGVAINLTVASHVFMMEPSWNPAVEWQAQDRIHRIGQFKPIWIVRFIIDDTIEEKILELQEKKKKRVSEDTAGSSSEAPGRLTVRTERDIVRNLQDMIGKEVMMEGFEMGSYIDRSEYFVKDIEKCVVVEGKINNVIDHFVETLGGSIFSSCNLGNFMIQVKP